MRIVLVLSMVAVIAVLSGCTSGGCCGMAKATHARPAMMASGSSSGEYAPTPARGVVVRRAARPAPAKRIATYAPPPAPALPVAKPCAPVVEKVACEPKADDCCPGGICGVPSADDCCPGGVCGVPTLDEIFKIGCK